MTEVIREGDGAELRAGDYIFKRNRFNHNYFSPNPHERHTAYRWDMDSKSREKPHGELVRLDPDEYQWEIHGV